MLVETSEDKITITVSASVDEYGLNRVLDYLKYLEIASKSKATQEDADKLAKEVNASWWQANKEQFGK
jgi:hypothetical protein